MSKYQLGWPDLLLLFAFLPALTGHFYLAMATLALYAVLYHRATRKQRARQEADHQRLTRADVARIYGVPDYIMAELPMPPKRDQ